MTERDKLVPLRVIGNKANEVFGKVKKLKNIAKKQTTEKITDRVYSSVQKPKIEIMVFQLDMEVFDHSSGGLFTDSSITCWNPETKETRVIK